jgi:hypothetical protein
MVEQRTEMAEAHAREITPDRGQNDRRDNRGAHLPVSMQRGAVWITDARPRARYRQRDCGEGTMAADVSIVRLYVLRATYLLLVVGLGVMIWPRLVGHTEVWAVKYGDTYGLLSGVQLLAVLGLRYPLKLLPLLFFEFVWKTVWLLTIAWPLWRAHAIDGGSAESI